jgi:uncharacterized caspase-like protein
MNMSPRDALHDGSCESDMEDDDVKVRESFLALCKTN